MIKLNLVISFILAGQMVFYSYGYTQEEKASQKPDALLNIYNWEDYFAPATLEEFEKKFGVKVNLETFTDEEEMIAGIQSNPGKYDLTITSDIIIRELIASRLLEPIDFKNVPNFKNIDGQFINSDYDSGNKYSVPYMWGTTGVAYNTKYVQEDVDSWAVLWNSAYKGKISMLDNHDEVVMASLKYLGVSLNTVDTVQLEQAKKKLLEQKPLLRGYDDIETIKDDLIAEKLWVAHCYSGDAMFAADKNDNLKYVIPEEGATLWVDNLCIPRDAPHKRTAEVFINYLLEPKVSAEIANYVRYANCNIAAREFTLKEILDDQAIYPSKEVLKKCEFKKGKPDEMAVRNQVINKIWSELQGKED